MKMKLMKTMKMCLKYMLLFTIPCFRAPDEKKIEVEDEKGRKEENNHNSVFLFYPNRPNPYFQFNSKTRKTAHNSFLIHI